MNNIIIIDNGITDESYSKIGGKGKGFVKLLRVGAKIPKTIGIPAGSDIKKAMEETFDYFDDGEEKKLYAVRSSASIEDGRTKSFAGQFESYLRVKGKKGITECGEKIRNLLNPDNTGLMKYAGDEFKDAEMCIIVQEMIDADFAGVLFTCDPVSGSRNHITIETVTGTAEDLLGGTRHGEGIVTDRQGNLINCELPGFAGDESMKKLVTEALEIEKALKTDDFNGPFDFEWAVKNGEIYWLQIRPVTVAGSLDSSREEVEFVKFGVIPEAENEETHWTSINAREALPFVLTPLVSDIVLDFTDKGMKEMVRTMGVADETLKKYKTFGLFNGRVFMNVTDLDGLMGHLPIKNPEALTQAVLTGKSEEPPQLKLSFSLPGPIIKMIEREIKLDSIYDNYVKKERKKWRFPDKDSLKKVTDKEMCLFFDEILDFTEGFPIHLVGGSRYANSYPPLEKICMKYNESPSTLIQGLGTLFFASSAESLRDVAFALKDKRDLLFDGKGRLKDEWSDIIQENPDLQDFGKIFNDYIEKYGHLGDGSVDLYKKNYREEPEKVLLLALEILKSGDVVTCDEYMERLGKEREKRKKEIRSKLGFIERLKFDFILGVLTKSAHFRENIKFLFARRLAIFKEYLKEVTGRLKEKGVITLDDDLFFVTYSELKGLIMGEIPDGISDKIMERKSEYKKRLSIPCPLHRMESESGSRLIFALHGAEKGRFQGIGASAGKVTGKAKVILSLSEAERLEPGEILVTIATEPSWTPLFSIAGGVVVEIGNLLSHGAVVARETGIPAVIGIPGITGEIIDGDTLVIDGTRGTVEIMREE